MNILFIVGARPQFIKLAPLIYQINKNNYNIDFNIVHTGQHYDFKMSNIFFQQLHIPEPDINLEVGSGLHGEQTGKMIEGCEKYLKKINPDLTVVFGDTNSTLAGALASSKLHIPIVHVESGLRSYNMLMPEEQNRILTDNLSSYLFCPTEIAVENLKDEGIYNKKRVKGLKNNRIIVRKTGDLMYDLAKIIISMVENENKIINEFNVGENEYILATIHREENTDNITRLKQIVEFMKSIDEDIILLAHPRTRKMIDEYNINISGNIIYSKPVGYRDMLVLEKNSKYIFTDSGGVQKEAYFFKKPCLTIRKETEWMETIKSKWNILGLADNKETLQQAYKELKSRNYSNLPSPEFYGTGNSAEIILRSILTQ